MGGGNSHSWQALVNYVIEALKNASQVANIVVVAPRDIKDALSPEARWVEAGDSLTENIFRAMDVIEKKNNVLFVTSDVPFLHGEAIDDFIHRCGELSGEIFYPLVSREATSSCIPRPYVLLHHERRGLYGGNILLANPQAVMNCWIMDEVIARRKKPWKIIRMLGFFFILKFLTKQLTLRELEQRASEILGHSGMLIISPYPELSTDVDKPSDLQLAEKTISAVQGKEA